MLNFKERRTTTPTVKVLPSIIPSILISSTALSKMSVFVDECSDEIGWLGTAYKNEEHNFININDVFLFDQEVHATTTEITPEGLSDFATELLEQPDGIDIWNNMKIWGHSHVRMAVSPSGQDDSQMATFSESGHDWFLRLIANKNGEMKIDLYDYKTGVIYLDMPWVEFGDDEDLVLRNQIAQLEAQLEAQRAARIGGIELEIKEEMKVKVRKKSTVVKGFTQSNWQANRQQSLTTQTISNPTKNGGKEQEDSKSTTKKKESERGTSRFGKRGYNDDHYTMDDEILEDFTEADLEYFSQAATLADLEEVLSSEYGYYGYFTLSDLERIYRVALKVEARNYNNQFQGGRY